MSTRIDVVGLSRPTTISKFVEFACKELDINPKIITLESMHQNVYFSEKTIGFCIDLEPGHFLIMVYEANRNITQICNTIAHEMIHVKQYLKENLGYLIDTCSNIPYHERWWEIEAFNNSGTLVEKFVRGL